MPFAKRGDVVHSEANSGFNNQKKSLLINGLAALGDSHHQGVTDAWSLGITSIPAVVVDQRYVVYGEPDVARAVARIEQRRRTQP